MSAGCFQTASRFLPIRCRRSSAPAVKHPAGVYRPHADAGEFGGRSPGVVHEDDPTKMAGTLLLVAHQLCAAPGPPPDVAENPDLRQ